MKASLYTPLGRTTALKKFLSCHCAHVIVRLANSVLKRISRHDGWAFYNVHRRAGRFQEQLDSAARRFYVLFRKPRSTTRNDVSYDKHRFLFLLFARAPFPSRSAEMTPNCSRANTYVMLPTEFRSRVIYCPREPSRVPRRLRRIRTRTFPRFRRRRRRVCSETEHEVTRIPPTHRLLRWRFIIHGSTCCCDYNIRLASRHCIIVRSGSAFATLRRRGRERSRKSVPGAPADHSCFEINSSVLFYGKSQQQAFVPARRDTWEV